MDRVVRAVGRIVVWVEAAADVSTIRISRWDRKLPSPLPPNTALPSTDSTSPELSWLPSPMPWSPIPAKDWAARVTTV